jgi:S-adenosylmethionine:tRNA ribosyltransferase-isomerase
VVRFEWDGPQAFGEVLEALGRVPIPPYLNRESEAIDTERYQTVYSRIEGSVAAPTAGLHFTPEIISALPTATGEVTLHVGAGTFLPVKADDPRDHTMHTEHFEISAELLDNLIEHAGRVTAVGTTTVRTLESLVALGWRVMQTGSPEPEKPVGQWELYDIPPADTLPALRDWMAAHGHKTLKAATQIMIMPGYDFRVVNAMFTNFHQPKSTLLLLVSAFVGGRWKEIYDYALAHDFRFLSYGDSSLLFR